MASVPVPDIVPAVWLSVLVEMLLAPAASVPALCVSAPSTQSRSASVQVPVPEMVRLLKCEKFDVMPRLVDAPLSVTVPVRDVKVALFVKLPPTVSAQLAPEHP